MFRLILISCGIAVLTAFSAGAQDGAPAVTAADIAEIAALPRPRLFFPAAADADLHANAATPWGRDLEKLILTAADIYAKSPVPERSIGPGNRTLEYNRGVLRRICVLGVAYRLRGNAAHAARARAELRAIAALPEWHLRFLLDTAEMTLAAAIGYDWFHAVLPEAERTALAAAIRDKGLKPTFDRPDWDRGTNNRTQVHHAAALAGAIAIADREPELARAVFNRALLRHGRMLTDTYAPNGAYPEGPGYWAYGTNFTCLTLQALTAACGTDYGFGEIPGWRQTGAYAAAVTGNTGALFAYSDSGGLPTPALAYFYFAHRYHAPVPPSAHAAITRAVKAAAQGRADGFNRLLPLALFWCGDLPEKTASGAGFYYSGAKSPTQIAVWRNGMGENDAYLAVKAGSPRASHGHLDGGSFVYEAAGCRWVDDRGTSNYGEMEKKGAALNDNGNNGKRWQVFRLGPDSHSVPRIDGQTPRADGTAAFTAAVPGDVRVDLTPLYPETQSFVRSFQLAPDGTLTVTDRVRGARPGAELAFCFCGAADSGNAREGALELRQGGTRLRVTAAAPGAAGTWDCRPAGEFLRPWDVPEPGVRVSRYRLRFPGDGAVDLSVKFSVIP